jgi:hypothetical protein
MAAREVIHFPFRAQLVAHRKFRRFTRLRPSRNLPQGESVSLHTSPRSLRRQSKDGCVEQFQGEATERNPEK